MSFQVTTAFVQQYRNNVMHLLQQRGSRFRGTVMNESVTGEVAYFEQIGSVEASLITNRHGDSPLMNTPHARRRVSMADYEWGDLVDNLDKVRMLIDPTSSYAQAGAWAMGRTIDDIIIAAFFATAVTGKDGSGTAAFPATQDIAVNNHDYDAGSGNVGLTVGKLIAAQELFSANEVPEEEVRHIAPKAQQIAELLTENEITSADYNNVKALVKGEINTFMGFNFMRSERITVDSSTDYAQVPAWVSSGMGLGVGKEPVTRIQERPDKRFSVYVYLQMSFGATRIEEPRVVRIYCDQSP